MRRRQRRLRQWLRHERMTVAMALAEAQHHTVPRGQRTARAGVWGRELNYTATIRDPPHPSRSSSALKESPAERGQTGCLPCLDRTSGHSGAPCSRSSILSLCFRLSMILRLRWWNSCQTCSISCVLSHLILSRLSKCPRSCPWTSLCELLFASRSWWNSWLKCRRSFPSPRCSGLRSRTSTFQLLVVVELVEVFPVFSLDSTIQ